MKKKTKLKKTPTFTYRVLKSSVYVLNQIRDLTNSNDMPRSRSQWLFLEKNIVIAIELSFMDRF